MPNHQQRQEEARLFKWKKIKYDIKIKDDGLCEIEVTANPVSTTRRVKEIEHFLIARHPAGKGELARLKIIHKGGEEVREDPEIEKENDKVYIYVILKKPLRRDQDTTYMFTEKSKFKLFFMSLEEFNRSRSEKVDEYFEYFGFPTVRTTDSLEIDIQLPEGFLNSVKKSVKNPVFCKATIGDIRPSPSHPREIEKITTGFKVDIENSKITTRVENPTYSVNYAVCWYLPKQWPLK